MTIREFKDIIDKFPDDAIMLVQVSHEAVADVEAVVVDYHSEGLNHVTFSPYQ